MARRRQAAQSADEQPQAAEPVIQEPRREATAGPESAPAAAEAGQPRRSKWLDRFDSWGDHEAGVQVIDDRANRRMIVKFDEKPSDPVLQVVKTDPYSYKFDDKELLWHKKYTPATARQARTEADKLGFTVANIIRQEKGLEVKQAFGLGM